MVASFWTNFCAPVAAFRATAPCSQQRSTLLCLMLPLSSPPVLPHASAYLKNGRQLLEKLLCPRSGLQGDGPLRPTTIYISLPHAFSFFPDSASTCNRLVENGRQLLEKLLCPRSGLPGDGPLLPPSTVFHCTKCMRTRKCVQPLHLQGPDSAKIFVDWH